MEKSQPKTSVLYAFYPDISVSLATLAVNCQFWFPALARIFSEMAGAQSESLPGIGSKLAAGAFLTLMTCVGQIPIIAHYGQNDDKWYLLPMGLLGVVTGGASILIMVGIGVGMSFF